MFDLTGKTALVTGASGGIGGAIARALHEQGAHVVLSGTREALDALRRRAGRADLAPPADLSTRCGRRPDRGGGGRGRRPVDILVANAGITKDGLLLRMKDEDWAGGAARSTWRAISGCRARR